MTTAAENVVRCPGCGGKDVRPSYSAAGLRDLIMRAFSLFPFRCRECRRRFYRRLKVEEEETEATSTSTQGSPDPQE